MRPGAIAPAQLLEALAEREMGVVSGRIDLEELLEGRPRPIVLPGVVVRPPERLEDARLARLVAIGPLEDDPAVLAVVGMAVGSLYFALRGSGLSSAATVETELALVIPWLEARLR